MEQTRIKNCPFCKGKAYYIQYSFSCLFVGCLDKYCRGHIERLINDYELKKTIKQWSKRVVTMNITTNHYRIYKLLNCPFCGDDCIYVHETVFPKEYYVSCGAIKCIGNLMPTSRWLEEEMAIIKWNQRN